MQMQKAEQMHFSMHFLTFSFNLLSFASVTSFSQWAPKTYEYNSLEIRLDLDKAIQFVYIHSEKKGMQENFFFITYSYIIPENSKSE
jgi:hypothetical protein